MEGQPLLSGRALELTRRALAHPSVNLSPDQVDHVLMAGNSTNIPLVQRTMEELFGPAKVVRKVHPKHAVAMGAAMVAAWMGQQCVCTAPDPEDATRECGHVNDDEAKACKRCGAALGSEGVSESSTLDRHAVAVSLGGIAPFSYGTGTAGDAFHVFIRKGDPFPTQSPESQVFRTRIPRQRMVSIPIFGGDNLERASANEKQGEAFAVLPPDLPVGTVVRVKLWLDRDGVFDVAAHLEDGSDLKPWVVKGEQDARAIDVIQQVDKALAAEGAHLPAAALAEVDAARSRVFERLRRHDFEGALHEAAQAQARIEAAATDSREAVSGGGGPGLAPVGGVRARSVWLGLRPDHGLPSPGPLRSAPRRARLARRKPYLGGDASAGLGDRDAARRRRPAPPDATYDRHTRAAGGPLASGGAPETPGAARGRTAERRPRGALSARRARRGDRLRCQGRGPGGRAPVLEGARGPQGRAPLPGVRRGHLEPGRRNRWRPGWELAHGERRGAGIDRDDRVPRLPPRRPPFGSRRLPELSNGSCAASQAREPSRTSSRCLDPPPVHRPGHGCRG